MQMVIKALLVLTVLWASFLLIAPKKELYYTIENKLKSEGIILDGEKITTHPFSLEVEGAELYYQGIDLGKIRKIVLTPYLFVNRLKITGFTPSPQLQAARDFNLSSALIDYRIWSPKTLAITADGVFGKIKGRMDLARHRLLLRWTHPGQIDNLRPYLKRDKKGWYYEQKF